MAERFYGLNRGESSDQVTEGSSSTATTDVEIRIDLAGIAAGGEGRAEVKEMVENIMRFIFRDTWPPA